MGTEHRVAVIGGGSFGTVIANIVAANGHAVSLWMRNAEVARTVNAEHVNSAYLPDYPLHRGLRATTDLADAVADVDVLFMAVPSSSCRQVAREVGKHLDAQAVVISMTKGIEAESFKLMSQVLEDELPKHRLGVLSGPNLAREIADGQLTGTVIASADDALVQLVQGLLHSGNFRVYASHDRYGVELGGALKNVYAIMAGLGAALEVGENTMGMLLTRSLAEMSRFAVDMGANPLTFLGLSGVGDLIVTCSSPLSRNYRVGFELGQGRALDDIVAELGQVAEGVNTLGSLKQAADARSVYMPLMSGLYAILYERQDLAGVIGGMMMAEQTHDVEFAVRKDSE
ncbi:NAD(P)H-dependent glycerol-3-phosphate dehydrogenase [Halieaceae bacterium IMCC14734]|uniref:Glycerol-3-phosphate dehydrogenase [NAD(P)+] n=1 Tax=Candidatus Litorirhabdus singularis TaxID=2518993 RepID=A0ABT3TGN0_9GAMM|nr:NAD(P)H-dependent glycerol-3-phosphate dehydrogenase [Candidatus Litorirhabdus singularis]MCX2981472.1 NAD(P)H-dependent glycerol-3-phosphate dehydrogenase [Candidatus Litorirhabdus singularis]